uniref:Protein MEMO1 n=1 Tax=Rhabditophanes sp. KR3021 TaxID=114890 RepID=A0AC35UDU9_9BILA
MLLRRATHAGSWYSDNVQELSANLDSWLNGAGEKREEYGAKAIISPHAGYSYCGKTAGYGFKQIDPSTVKRIFILGPCHVKYFKGCALTSCTHYETPLGNMKVDLEVNDELASSGHFSKMERNLEDQEHSLEMQLPFLARIMGQKKSFSEFTIIPILVGSLTTDHADTYGYLFEKFFKDPNTIFVISSDFSHWGQRFDYSPHKKSDIPIWKQISNLDHRGMSAIESLDTAKFSDYIKETQNTICGKNPIMILMETIRIAKLQSSLTFLDYSQSNQVTHPKESSVSYAAGVLFCKERR